MLPGKCSSRHSVQCAEILGYDLGMIGIYDIEQISSENGTLNITRSNNNRDTKCTFMTRSQVMEWDEIIIEDDYSDRLFAGIVEAPSVDRTNSQSLYTVSSNGYKKLFDRDKVQIEYEDTLAGDIIKDIIATYAPDFDDSGVEDGLSISKLLFNYSLPSEAVQRIADSIGYNWSIDEYKIVHFDVKAAVSASKSIMAGERYFSNLKISVDMSNFCNVVIVRGGTYLSAPIAYEEKGDGKKYQFVLPET